jgi:RNA polymerase sigma-70 factor (ECF subfamily)
MLDRLVAPRECSPGVAMDLERALRRLPDGARQIFVLYDVEGYGHEEIAGLMGISVGTSKSQLHRARMLLRGHLSG